MDIYAIAHELRELTERDSLMRQVAEGRLDPVKPMVRGEVDEVENYLFGLVDLTHNSSEELESWLEKKALASEVAENLAEFLEDFEFNGEEIEITGAALRAEVQNLVNLVNRAIRFVEGKPNFPGHTPTEFYVYVHVGDENGEVFYVGKGKGKRAWSTNREPYWHEYVESIGRKYTVKIVSEGLSESEALKQEEAMLVQNAYSVINQDRPVGISIGIQEPEA